MEAFRPLKVLVVDDEESFRMSLEIALTMSDRYSVEMCGSGEEAVELLMKQPYDVVLLDYRMGEMSGLDVLEWLHTNKVDTPVIMLTAAGSEEVAVDAMKLGAYDYLSKEHIEIDRLPLTINSVHERAQYRRSMLNREREERREQERQKDLISLQTFQSTVNSLGQFVNNGLAGLAEKIRHHEDELLKYVTNDGRKPLLEAFTSLKHEFEVMASGVKSMLDLSALVTQKLEGIQHNVEQPESEKAEEGRS